jgi:hypothetical protein
MGMLPIAAHNLDFFQKLRSFRKGGNGLDIHPADETSYSTQYHQAFLIYVENEYWAKYRRVPVNSLEIVPSSNVVPSATASKSDQESFDPDDSSSDEEQCITPNTVAETTPGRSDSSAH